MFQSVEEFISVRTENKHTAQKTERDVRSIERFLKTKDEDRKIENISAAELSEYIISSALKMAPSMLRFEV